MLASHYDRVCSSISNLAGFLYNICLARSILELCAHSQEHPQPIYISKLHARLKDILDLVHNRSSLGTFHPERRNHPKTARVYVVQAPIG